MEKFIEIERKFLPSDHFDLAFIQNKAQQRFEISQGYICNDPQRTVRVRTKGNKGFLTIKGKGTADGASRFEWEKEIPTQEALMLLELCENKILKTRYEVVFREKVFEIDVFEAENAGLTIIEIELESASEVFEKPDWLGSEVTQDVRYFNAYLSQNPFQNWL